MKANELRIGNLVEINAPIINKVIAVDVYHISKIKKNKDCCKPIPLTEEWLLKFGFEKTEWDNNNSFRKMIGNNDYTIVFYSNGICEISDIITKKIDYVHQLQNLYFALTGEELTLKK